MTTDENPAHQPQYLVFHDSVDRRGRTCRASREDEVFAAAGVAEQVRLAETLKPDAVVIACFGDPGLDAAREATNAPVLGIAVHLVQRLGVPVIDGVAVAVKFSEAFVSLGLGTSRYGDYASPLAKTYMGWATPLGRPSRCAISGTSLERFVPVFETAALEVSQ